MRKKGWYEKTVTILLIWTVFQEIVLGLLYHYIHITPLIKIIFFSKDIIFVLLFLFALVRTKLPQSLFGIGFIYLMLVVLGSGYSIINREVSFMTVLSSGRGLILLPGFLTIGYSVDESYFDSVKDKYMTFFVTVALLGIAEFLLDLIIGTKGFWVNIIQLGSYMSDIKGAGATLLGNLPGNFYTYSSLGHYSQKRLVSLWGGPLTSGYCLLIPFVYYLNSVFYSINKKTKKKNIACFIIVATALFLTFTRGVILPALAFSAFFCLYQFRKRLSNLVIITVTILLLGLSFVILFWEQIYNYLYNGSTAAHIESVKSAGSLVSFWGHGTGTFAAANTEGIWTESTYISVAGQLGVFAVFMYILLFLLPIYSVFKKKRTIDKFAIVVAMAGIIYLVTGLISEQLMAYTSIAPYYALAGIALKKSNKINGVYV